MARLRIAFAASILMLTACASTADSPPSLVGTQWHLVSADRGGLAAHATASRVTIEFSADRLSGFGGCNTYSGGYTLSGTTLTPGPIASTKRACLDSAGNNAELAWLAALSDPLEVSQVDGRLHLRSVDGAILQFETGPAK